MSAREERDGFAGVVNGPYVVIADLPGFPNKPHAAFLREQDRELYVLALRLKQALDKKDGASARDIIQELKQKTYLPVHSPNSEKK